MIHLNQQGACSWHPTEHDLPHKAVMLGELLPWSLHCLCNSFWLVLKQYRHAEKQVRVPAECTGIAGTTLTVARSLSPPETASIVRPPTVPAHSSLWGVAHVRRGKERRSSSPLHVREASSCRAVHAKCRTWLLLHHSERQPLPPSHYFGPWRSYSRMYANPWPTGPRG